MIVYEEEERKEFSFSVMIIVSSIFSSTLTGFVAILRILEGVPKNTNLIIVFTSIFLVTSLWQCLFERKCYLEGKRQNKTPKQN